MVFRFISLACLATTQQSVLQQHNNVSCNNTTKCLATTQQSVLQHNNKVSCNNTTKCLATTQQRVLQQHNNVSCNNTTKCLATTKSISNKLPSHSASLIFGAVKPVCLNYVSISISLIDVPLCMGSKIFCMSSRSYSCFGYLQTRR